MKLKDVLKGAIIGVFITTIVLSLGQCTRSVEAAGIMEVAVADWKQCNTRVTIANDTTDIYYYVLYWIDHGVKEWDGLMERAGGELAPQGIHKTSKNFRLCPGKHIMVWYKRGDPKAEIMKFMVEPDMTSIVILPAGVQPKYDYFYKEPEQEDV